MTAISPLRIVFMGTPGFAVPVLSELLGAGHDVVGVYTQPDRPAGRGRQVAPQGVKKAALDLGLRLVQPPFLRRDERARQELASLSPDLVVVAAYGLFLPDEILVLPRLGCLNIHPSLLPRYRGPSPVAAAIIGGDAVAGVTVIQLDDDMDHGPIVAQRDTPIGPNETAGELTERLFVMGAELLPEVLPDWESGAIQARPQDESEATFTGRLTKGDGEIDWGRPAGDISRQVRAYNPWPGSFTSWRGRRLSIVEASAVEAAPAGSAHPGQVVSTPDGVGIVTGDGLLQVAIVQLEGRRLVRAQEFMRGHRDFVGSQVGG